MRIHFYATRNDLLELVILLEEKQQVRYVLMGNFLAAEPIVTLDTLQGPELGVAKGQKYGNPSYMVFPTGTKITPRPVAGGARYVIDPGSTAGGIYLCPGGQHVDGILIESEIYNFPATPEPPLAKFFAKELKRRATKIGYAYVCREAEQLLDRGWRLVQDARTSTAYDLSRPRVIEFENRDGRLSYVKSCQFLEKHDIGGCEFLRGKGWDGNTEPPMPNTMPLPGDEDPCGINFFKTIFTGEKDDQINLENLTLPRTFINRTGFSHVSFAGSDLSESFMCWNDFESCDFTSANLSGCDMRASQFVKCKFRSANLQGADFRWSTLTGCDFTDANMVGTILDDTAKPKPLLKKLSDKQRKVISWAPDAGAEPPGG